MLVKYFRVGHMGYSVYAGHVDKLTKALEESLRIEIAI